MPPKTRELILAALSDELGAARKNKLIESFDFKLGELLIAVSADVMKIIQDFKEYYEARVLNEKPPVINREKIEEVAIFFSKQLSQLVNNNKLKIIEIWINILLEKIRIIFIDLNKNKMIDEDTNNAIMKLGLIIFNIFKKELQLYPEAPAGSH